MQARNSTAEEVSAVEPVRPVNALTPEADSIKVLVTVGASGGARDHTDSVGEQGLASCWSISRPSHSPYVSAGRQYPPECRWCRTSIVMQKVMISVMAVNQPMFIKPTKVKLEERGRDHVGEGRHEACGLKACKGFTPRNAKRRSNQRTEEKRAACLTRRP